MKECIDCLNQLLNNIVPPIFKKDDISLDPLTLLSYQGGPGSVLGIGPTKIRLASNPVIKVNAFDDLYNPNVNYLTLSYRGLNTAVSPTETLNTNITVLTPFTLPFEVPLNNVTSQKYELNNPRSIKGYIPTQNQIDFRQGLRQAIEITSRESSPSTTLMSQAPSYDPKDNKTLEQRTNLGDPGNRKGKDLTSYVSGSGTSGNYLGAASLEGNGSYDKINASEIYQSSGPKGTINPDTRNNDLVKFRIGVIDNDTPSLKTYIHFRAFLNGISDQYKADWKNTKYIGRGEDFYTYSGFSRNVSLSWTVVAQSKVELIPMYKKLNYLASICAPDYSDQGYMRGNIVTLTIGGYFYEQPGIITGLSYEMNDDNATWEIGIDDAGGVDNSVRELPHLIKVNSFNFTPIHNFVPKLQKIGRAHV